jgi:hypothetical protein
MSDFKFYVVRVVNRQRKLLDVAGIFTSMNDAEHFRSEIRDASIPVACVTLDQIKEMLVKERLGELADVLLRLEVADSHRQQAKITQTFSITNDRRTAQQIAADIAARRTWPSGPA